MAYTMDVSGATGTKGTKMKNSRVLSWEVNLVHRATEGETVAFELLMDMYRPTLASLAGRMLRNADDASDAVQETVVKAYRAIHDFDPDRPLRPWLCRICTNCCVDTVRSRRRDGDSLDEHEHLLPDPTARVEERAGGAIRQGQVMDAIARLPERYRSIILMRHFRHMEVTEIAQELKKPEGTIKSWLFRARAMLKKDLRLALG